jgi:hypothetical protein
MITYQDHLLPVRLKTWENLVAYAGPLGSAMRRSTYRPFMRAPVYGLAFAQWLSGFATRRRQRFASLASAGLPLPGPFRLVNVLNCAPAACLPQGTPFSCNSSLCPFCHARDVARTWSILNAFLFEDRPGPRPDLAIVITKRVIATLGAGSRADLTATVIGAILSRSASSGRKREFKARGVIGGIESVCARSHYGKTEIQVRQLLLFPAAADGALPTFPRADGELVDAYSTLTPWLFLNGVSNAMAYPTIGMRGPIPHALAFAAALGTTKRYSAMGILHGIRASARLVTAPPATSSEEVDAAAALDPLESGVPCEFDDDARVGPPDDEYADLEDADLVVSPVEL